MLENFPVTVTSEEGLKNGMRGKKVLEMQFYELEEILKRLEI